MVNENSITGAEMASFLRALADRMERMKIVTVYYNLRYGTREIEPEPDENGQPWRCLEYSGLDLGRINFTFRTVPEKQDRAAMGEGEGDENV